jgi:hypothetical protein
MRPAAEEIGHVMTLYLKEMDISGLATNGSLEEVFDRTMGREYDRGSQTTASDLQKLLSLNR